MEPLNIRRRKLVVASVVVTVAAVVIAIVVLGVLFVTASQEARVSATNATFPRDVLGVPILEGFKLDGRTGVHLFGGILLFPAIVFAIAIVSSLPAVRSFVTSND